MLESAIIDVATDGTVLVYVDGEPLLAFPSAEAFFGAHSVSHRDLVAKPALLRPITKARDDLAADRHHAAANQAS